MYNFSLDRFIIFYFDNEKWASTRQLMFQLWPADGATVNTITLSDLLGQIPLSWLIFNVCWRNKTLTDSLFKLTFFINLLLLQLEISYISQNAFQRHEESGHVIINRHVYLCVKTADLRWRFWTGFCRNDRKQDKRWIFSFFFCFISQTVNQLT